MYGYVKQVPINVSRHCAVTYDKEEGFFLLVCLIFLVVWLVGFVLFVSWEVDLVSKVTWCVYMRT